jgi:hypothetical protein
MKVRARDLPSDAALRSMCRAVATTAIVIAALFSQAGLVAAAWGPETPPFNLEAVLRDVTGGPGCGLVKFRQPNDETQIVYLDTWVRGLASDHSYVLQRAVDTNLDGACTSTAWLTLGKGLAAQAIMTDGDGTGRETLFRNLPLAPGTQLDIHFRVADAGTLAPILSSRCYRLAVSP